MKTLLITLLMMSILTNSFAQPSLQDQIRDTIYLISEKARYVDFHIHTIMKNYYRETMHPDDVKLFPQGDIRNWKIFKSKVHPSEFNNVKSVDQATYSLLSHSQASILCTSLYTMEKQSLSDTTLPVTGLILNNRFKKFVRFTPLAKLDEIFSLRWVNKIAVTGIEKERQKTAYEAVSNFDELKAQLGFLEKQAKSHNSYKPVHLAKTKEDLDDSSKIWLVLTIEGAHNFYGNNISRITDVMGHQINTIQEEEILRNLDSIKNAHRLFFVTPGHLFENKIAGGARGLDIDKSIFRAILSRLMWDKRFSIIDNKDIEGINHIYKLNAKTTPSVCNCAYANCDPTDKSCRDTVEIGWKFINNALQPNKAGKRTYIDMRHMDVLARIQIIEKVTEMNMELKPEEQIPLVISHTAVSGKKQSMAKLLGLCPNYDDYEEFTPKKIRGYYKHFAKECSIDMGVIENNIDSYLDRSGWFHPMSNNLYDEEIEAVYKTNGILGITMEERALGAGGYNYKINYKTKDSLSKYFDRNYNFSLTGKQRRGLKDQLLIAEPFVRNLFYIVEHSGEVENDIKRGTIKSWEHIAIGSDFDGIMNPIDMCPTAADIPAFYSFLVQNLKFYAAYLGKENLLFNQEPADLLSLVFYKNGERFIKKYF